MRLAAAACGFGVLICVAAVGAVLSKNVSISVSAPAPEVAPAASAKTVAVRTVTDVPDTRPLYPDYPPTAANPAPISPSAPTTTGQSPGQATTATAPVEPGQTPAPVAASTSAESATPTAERSQPLVMAQNTPATPPAPAPAAASCPGNPNALGVSRTVEIDTTGGPGFGFEHFKSHDFLREGEIVLTFDDGPWPRNTHAVLAALAHHCTKAIFFPIGLHATYEPMLLKQVAAAGHAVGSHTWSHQMLDKTKGRFKVNGKTEVREFDPKDEIEKGISAVHWAVGGPTAPYFRFPGLKHPPELVKYLGERNIAIFSTDLDSFDFKMRKPEQVRQSVLAKLKKHGKGIVLMHDFQHSTAEAAAALLDDLKAAGYKVVFMKPKFAVTTLPAYDEMVIKELKLPTVDARPTSSVVRTIGQ
jgi:peptidoglycan/xylan/chitin deacetylase (PgdA/CDA1 family)